MNDIYTEKISEWFDNELNAQEVVELQDHLAHCSACRQTYESMQRAHVMLLDAAQTMVAPGNGFVQRFEPRLAYAHVHKPWHIWVALIALLTGTVLFFGTWAVMGGLMLSNAGASALDAQVLYQGVTIIFESAASLRTFVNTTLLFWKTGLFLFSQPLVWLLVILSVCATWLWLRILQLLSRRPANSIELTL
ncbi:MAG: zf-HC2 domain-containing protein [Anaerolineae bacterium]|nr:zf-HC2 domain-containing protein [Anaerolineae bacterium]